jgi:methylated-DNA-protein-cysteine methyltransferase-like protein
MPNHSRHVGQGEFVLKNLVLAQVDFVLAPALKFLSPNTNPPVPWHRVIGASGVISSRGPGTQGAQRQADTLTAEGVEVSTGRTGELRVDFGRWGWFPQPGQIPGQLDGDEDDGPDSDEAAS